MRCLGGVGGVLRVSSGQAVVLDLRLPCIHTSINRSQACDTYAYTHTRRVLWVWGLRFRAEGRRVRDARRGWSGLP